MMWAVAAVALALALLHGQSGVIPHVRAQDSTRNFFFFWPEVTRQCQNIDLTWNNAEPPFTAYVVPIFGRPFIYDIPDEAYSNGSGRYTIELQLQQGAYYTIFMSDARGFGSGGSAEVSVVAASYVTSCLNTISANQTSQQFSFTPAGRARQCLRGFDIDWNASPQDTPYNMSIIPLDQGFYPYEVELANGGWDGDWQVNMTAGTRFTVMLNSARGYGRGGIGGIYEVANSTRTDCVLQEPQPTGSWPPGLATNTLASSTNPPDDESTGLTGGAIAGIVIGVLAFFILLGLVLFFLLRRKRRRQAAEDKVSPMDGTYGVDLGEYDEPVENGENENNVNPFQSPISPSADNDTGTHTHTGTGESNAGFAGLGAAGAAAGAAGGSRQAEALPPKIRTSTDHRENLRVANHEDPTALPTLPRGASLDEHPPVPSPQRQRRSQDHLRQPTFRRHEDAGRWRGADARQQDEEEVVDLPPLYTDIHRDAESEAGR